MKLEDLFIEVRNIRYVDTGDELFTLANVRDGMTRAMQMAAFATMSGNAAQAKGSVMLADMLEALMAFMLDKTGQDCGEYYKLAEVQAQDDNGEWITH